MEMILNSSVLNERATQSIAECWSERKRCAGVKFVLCLVHDYLVFQYSKDPTQVLAGKRAAWGSSLQGTEKVHTEQIVK